MLSIAVGHLMGPRLSGMACCDWSCFKMRCPHIDRSQIRFWGTHLNLSFCDSEGAAPDSKTWRRVTEPWKSDSCANAVTKKEEESGCHRPYRTPRRSACSRRADRAGGSGVVGGAQEQWPVIAMLCRQVDTGRGSCRQPYSIWNTSSQVMETRFYAWFADSRSRFYDSETNAV